MLPSGFDMSRAGKESAVASRFRRDDWSGLALIAAGFILVASTIAGYVVGMLIDRALHSSPRWAITGLILGVIVGFWDLYSVASRLLASQPPVSASPLKEEPPSDENE